MYSISRNSLNLSAESRVKTLARRIHGWSWQAFSIDMGTGAVYVTLHDIKWHPSALTTVEKVLFYLNISLFVLNLTMLGLQAIMFPKRAWRLIQDPVNGAFVPLAALSFATIVIGTINYAVPAGQVGPGLIYALFWIYVAFALLTSLPMLMIWFSKPHSLTHFTPIYAFLIFPMMLVGVIAFNVLKVIPAEENRAVGVLFIGYFFQGLGFFMTFFYICLYIIRMTMTGFPSGSEANGAFIVCGPPGFTALALINLGVHAEDILSAHNLLNADAGKVWYAGSVMAALLLYGLVVFLFLFGFLPYWFRIHRDMHLKDILGCWALTFPNVGWISTTRVLADTLNIPGFFVVHLIMTILECIVWVVLFVFTAAAFWRGLILYSAGEGVARDFALKSRCGEKDARLTTPTITTSGDVPLV